MTINEQFSDILKREAVEEMVSFLKKISAEEKPAFTKFLKKQRKEYYGHQGSSGLVDRRKVTRQHFKIIERAAAFCFTLKEFRTVSWSFDIDVWKDVLSVYQPKWFEGYLNNFATGWLSMDLHYNWVMQLAEAGKIKPSDELLVRTLCNAFIVREKETHFYRFTPENLEEFPITLKQHFWLFFDYETNVYFATRWTHFVNKPPKEKTNWIAIILDLVARNKLPRQRLLQSCLTAATRNFNRNLINWYIDLFLALQPTTEELLSLQEYLFTAFHAPQSKPVNAVLKLCKKLATQAAFDNHEFIEKAPILLASETKSVVSSTLMILDKLAKKEAQLAPEICLIVSDVFVNNDAALQVRAAKLLVKYGKPDDENLREKIAIFQNELLSEASGILADYLTEESVDFEDEMEDVSVEISPILTNENVIDFPQNFDDLVFLANEAMVGRASYQLELLAASLLRFQAELTVGKINKLTPAFQRAYKYIFQGTGNARVGHFELMMAHFMGEYAQFLMKKHPEATDLKKMIDALKAKQLKQGWHGYELPKIDLSGWKTYTGDGIFFPFKMVLKDVLAKLRNASKLPVLSTPSHEPYWLDPAIYVQRLAAYQQANQLPNQVDWQLAISRIAFENIPAAVALAKEKLRGEMLELTLFLLEKAWFKTGQLAHLYEWKMAALTNGTYREAALKSLFDDEVKLQKWAGEPMFSIEKYAEQESQYNYQTRKYEKVLVDLKNVIINGEKKPARTVWSKVKKVFLQPRAGRRFFLLDYIDIREFWVSGNVNDITRFLSLTPNNPAPVLAKVVQECLRHNTFWSTTDQKTTLATAQVLLENWRGGKEIDHLFISSALVCGDKTIRNIAAEIWIKGVFENTINSPLMGIIIGQMEAIEFFPLKRLIDALQNFMLKISKKHDAELRKMLVEIIARLPETPIRNTKKLLEIYRELLADKVAGEVPNQVVKKLELWGEISSLQKVCKDLRVMK